MDTVIQAPGRIAAGGVIDNWTAHDWREGFVVDQLLVHDRITVRTLHSVYEFVVVDAHAAEVMVRGGAYFQEFTRVRVAGCTLGGSFLKIRGIYVGFRVELLTDTQTILTSPVTTITVERGDRPPVHLM